MPQPSIGRIVHYRLTAADVETINKWREASKKEAMTPDSYGVIAQQGNPVAAGQVVAMMIVGIPDPDDPDDERVNGKCFLDGTDEFWAAYRYRGDGPGQWQWPFLVDENPAPEAA